MTSDYLKSSVVTFAFIGTFVFLAVSYYVYLIAPITASVIAYDMLHERKSKRIFLTAVLFAVIVGAICKVFFLTKSGLSFAGIAFVAAPSMVVLVAIGLWIVALEKRGGD